MSGPQLQEHLINSGIKIPVIFVTAFPRCNIRDRVMKQGAIAYLTKPLDRSTLQKRLQRALGDEGKVNVLRSGDS
jgi:FixJ family two-component response regulator